MTKCYKMIGIIKILSVNIPRDALLRIYKSFIRTHLDYGDIFYENLITSHLKEKLKILSTKLVLQKLVLFREHLVNAFIKNYA